VSPRPTHSTTQGGAASSQPLGDVDAACVATTTADGRNTLREALVPVASWRMDDLRFQFDSSFIRPEAADEFALLAVLAKEHPEAPIALFGHADPVGDDDYNKKLSGRRVTSVYAVLTRDTELWEDLYSHPHGRDEWGTRTIQLILQDRGHSPGAIDGVVGEQTRAAVKAFQGENGLAVDGVAGPKTREKLFLAYMDAHCRDEAGEPFILEKGDFLGQGADGDGRGDYQGCSEFNPVRMFSQEEDQRLRQAANHTERNRENAPNRRVVALLFRPGTAVPLDKWPCPAATAGDSDCRKRFWSDAATRRSFQAERREYPETRDTFACRFYDRIAGDSLIEIRQGGQGKLFMEIRSALGEAPLAGRHYSITPLGATTAMFEGTLDGEGRLLHADVPPDDYQLVVDDVVGEHAALVLDAAAREPQIRFLEA
jgi:hypothetical protein